MLTPACLCNEWLGCVWICDMTRSCVPWRRQQCHHWLHAGHVPTPPLISPLQRLACSLPSGLLLCEVRLAVYSLSSIDRHSLKCACRFSGSHLSALPTSRSRPLSIDLLALVARHLFAGMLVRPSSPGSGCLKTLHQVHHALQPCERHRRDGGC